MRKFNKTPDANYLHECFSLSENGRLFWRERPAHHFGTETVRRNFNLRFAGKEAGTAHKDGYLVVSMKGVRFLTHRLIYVMFCGPLDESMDVDHENCDRSDSRPSNLRIATRCQNLCNSPIDSRNTSGFKGVSFSKKFNIWVGYVSYKGRRYSKNFVDKLDAAKWSEEKRNELHGAFAKN